MGGDGPRCYRLGRAVQGAEARRLSFRGEPGDPLARRGHTRGIDAAELGRDEKRAARSRSDLARGPKIAENTRLFAPRISWPELFSSATTTTVRTSVIVGWV